ncbi:MAG: DNA topoisomerase 3 [Bacteroidaceae bacterium]|nr:DNA topoisomerase 3 [Bacteroidaceae bacterium]
MIVCIAEKPSVARDIANVLGATQQRDGYLEGNGFQVTWTFGHLCELKYPEDYHPQWRAWSLAALPMVPQPFGIRLKDDAGIRKQFATIEKLMQNAERIINCGDAGQEGELIQRWVMQKAGAKCPVSRLWISSLTEESIQQGFQALQDQSHYQSLYEAGLCRAIGDWLLGINATRLYTIKYGARRVGAPPLSVGRVQTPTLAMIVKRCREIRNFVPQPYWVLATVYRNTLFTATAGRYEQEEDGQAALERIRGKEFLVTEVSKKKGREAAPHLLDLTTLQVECNRKFSFSADQTLKVIQSLYEKKYTTYPRVDTTYLSDDIYPKCGHILNGLKDYQPLLEPLRGKKLPKGKKYFDSSKVTDHHAIIPTGVQPVNLSVPEQKVFDLVARRFISIFYPDCVFTTTTVTGQVEKDSFRVTGKQIEEEGWRAVFANDKRAEEDDDAAQPDAEERTLPDFSKGEHGEHAPQLSKKMTTAPKPYTEATLLRAMETAGRSVDNEELREAMKENGIGRPSTRAAIIETLFKRRYIQKERKSIFSTATGEELIDVIHEELIKSPELTGQWEKKLRDIEAGKFSSAQFVDELKQMVQNLVMQVLSDNSNRHVAVTEDAPKGKTAKGSRKATGLGGGKKPGKKKEGTQAAQADSIVGKPCPQCGQGHIIKGSTAYGCSRWREGCAFRQPFEP